MVALPLSIAADGTLGRGGTCTLPMLPPWDRALPFPLEAETPEETASALRRSRSAPLGPLPSSDDVMGAVSEEALGLKGSGGTDSAVRDTGWLLTLSRSVLPPYSWLLRLRLEDLWPRLLLLGDIFTLTGLVLVWITV